MKANAGAVIRPTGKIADVRLNDSRDSSSPNSARAMYERLGERSAKVA